jgi:hypothetical protein
VGARVTDQDQGPDADDEDLVPPVKGTSADWLLYQRGFVDVSTVLFNRSHEYTVPHSTD